MPHLLDDPTLAAHPDGESPLLDTTLAPDEIAVIARHEHLTIREAALRGAAMLKEPWGHAAMRQMVWDLLKEALRRGNAPLAAELTTLYRRTCRRYPSRYDRRHAPTRETHPLPPGI